MNKRHQYFNRIVVVFWVLLALISLMWLLNFGNGIFDEETFVRRIEVNDSSRKAYEAELKRQRFEDSLNRIRNKDTSESKNNIVQKKWSWLSSDGKRHSITFNLLRSDYVASLNRRRKISITGVELWAYMCENDRNGLSSMVDAYRQMILREKLDYFQAMDAVVSSIQSIPYTYVLCGNNRCGEPNPDDLNDTYPKRNCRPVIFPYGCCDDVTPWAVYSPLEFAMQETGDCDTKSLMAYILLDELNRVMQTNGAIFDVAMLMGDVEAGRHAMLGINIPNPPYREQFAYDERHVKYFAWEATTQGNLPGQRVWRTFRNWSAYKLN